MASDNSEGDVLLTRLADDFVARSRRGERPSLQEYVERYPELAADIRDLFPALVEIEQVKQDRSAAEQSQARRPVPALTLQQLGDYRLLREIGHGGMGIVYEAEQISLGRHVALKVLSQKLLADARQKRRFEREAKAAAKLHHTNIVPVFGIGEHEGTPYYVMQFIQGLGLDGVLDELRRLRGAGQVSNLPVEPRQAEHLPSNDLSAPQMARSLLSGRFPPPPAATVDQPPGPAVAPSETDVLNTPPITMAAHSDTSPSSSVSLPGQSDEQGQPRARKLTYWQSVAHIGAQVAHALEYAHRQGVQHRDIKPSNLLLDTQGTVWVTDFGLAKADDQENLTQTGDLLGTLRYMPPEAFEGRHDARGDVYGLGLTLYELIAFQPAFAEKERHRLIKQVTTSEPLRLGKRNPEVPRDLETIIHKAIDREPGSRYQTAGGLAADLERFLRDDPIQARRISVAERLTRWARHHKGVAAALAVIALLLVAVSVASSIAAVNFRVLADEADDARRKAEQATDASQRELYRANIAAATSALQLQNINSARRALEAAPEPYRNWEWRHLHSQLEGARLDLRGSKDVWPGSSPTVSPAGNQLAAWDEKDTAIRLWDLTTGKETAVLRGHEATGRILVYSPDGKRLASGSDDGTIRLWDPGKGQLLAVLRGHQAAVSWLAYSPDGRRIVSCDDRHGCRLWDAQGQHLADLSKGEGAGQPTFTPDSRRIALGVGRSVCLVDATTGRDIAVLGSHEHPPNILAMSPDGKRIASHGHQEDDLCLWDGAAAKEVAVLRGHTASPNSFVFSPDGLSLVSGSDHPDSSLRLWNAATGQLISVLEGHKNTIRSVAFSPDGRRLVSASTDQTAWLWDGVTGQAITPLRGHTGPVWRAFFSPDGKRIVTVSDDQTLRLWKAKSGELVAVLRGHRAGARDAAFSPDGCLLVSRSADGELCVWDMELAERNGILSGHTSFVYDVAFSPDGQRAASAAWDGSVRLWDVTTGRQLGLLNHDLYIVSSVAWHPGGKLLASVSRDDKVILWDLATGKRRHVFDAPTGHWTGDTRAAFNPAGTLLAAGSRDGRVRLWDVATGKPAGVLQGHRDLCVDVAFRPDGKQFASVSYDGTVRLWDMATRSTIAVFRAPSGYRLAYSADGRLIAVSMTDSVRLWDTQTHQELAVLPHGGKVAGLAFSPDGTRLAVGCADNTIRLWDVASRKEVAELRGHANYVHAVAFSPDGTRLISASGDSTVRVWDTLSPTERAKERK
jgi:WD40 repeat protein/serine/threonine protein kinase